jgi:hydrogenase large subunit
VTKAPDAHDRVRVLAVLKGFRGFLESELYADRLEAVAEIATPEALAAWAEGRGGDMALFLRLAADTGLWQMGQGPGRYLSFGAYETQAGHLFPPGLMRDGVARPVPFEEIVEDVSHAWMLGDTLHPAHGITHPDTAMEPPGYTWCKAPRIGGESVETGALARQAIDGHPLAAAIAARGGSAAARVVGRLLEIARMIPALESWAMAMEPGQPALAPLVVPEAGEGVGLVEAARGALGHWLRIEDGLIANYQIVAPTTWNFSPRDHAGRPGPVEAALVGAPVAEGEGTPVAVQHIVRSFDPCMVCTVH